MPYTSIFDGPTIITQKDMCEILNLNISRPGLKFSTLEIRTAYRKRALRFHPDTQNRFNPPIPEKICNILMSDIALARDYMLKGEDNIPGAAFLATSKKSSTMASRDLIDVLINILNGIQSGTSTISSSVPWISRFSNNFFIALLSSTFSNNQLNLRYINVYSKELDLIRPYLKDIDGNSLTNFLLQLKEALKSTDEVDIADVIRGLKEHLPESLTKNKKFEDLLVAIQNVNKKLKKMLTNDFIDHLKHIVQFWPNLIARIPSWRHIFSVYFISLLFTSSSLPKYFNATKIITEVIWEQQSTAGLVLSALPLLILTPVLLPLNISIQLGVQFAWIALRASYQILMNSIQLLSAVINIIRSLFNQDNSLSQSVFTLFESTLNLTVRLTVNIAIEILDEMTFILSNQSRLSSLQSIFNHWIDSTVKSLRSKAVAVPTFMTTSQDEIKEPLTHENPNQTFGFFEHRGLRIHNQEDRWLKKILDNFSVQHHDDEAQEGLGTNLAM